MTRLALYRKWRPRTFDEVIGQDHVTRTLRNALASGRISHAYLFAGVRGTGKTTMARLLAKAVNCEGESVEKPCGRCRICRAVDDGSLIDLIEIDAASNRGIDEIRDLRDKVSFRPNEARYKFYIIDEVHMLTEPAFNALLKTLEEPPAHVIFVLATTEPHKIPATILSRCQRFDFRRIPLADIIRWLKHIATQEGLSVEEAALEYIARQSGGSLRDAISLLDQLTAYSDTMITLDHVRGILGSVSSQAVSQLVDHLVAGERVRGLELINQLVWDGSEPRQLAREVVEHLRKMLLLKMGDGAALLRANTSDEELAAIRAQAGQVTPRWLLRAIRLFNQAALESRTSFIPQLTLELAFLEATSEEALEAAPAQPPAAQEVRTRLEAAVSPARAPGPTARAETARTPPPARPAVLREAPNDLAAPLVVPGQSGNVTLDKLRDNWKPVILAQLRKRDPMAQGLLNSVTLLDVVGDEVIVEAASDWLKGRIEQARTRSKIEACFKEVLGTPLRLRCVLQGEYQPRRTPNPVAAEESAAADPTSEAGVRDVSPHSQTAEAADDPLAEEIRRLGGVRTKSSQGG
ncbi:MAG: DNA polymerase III subunit gamma/tau [Anaerolineae bacterium]|nr:DNA polymerase III subunit gamma/tau [Anaerolineae bacterium]MDW8071266.1 DNA polymerase III subunit gamma/tau [Anaerolineae bacterium]